MPAYPFEPLAERTSFSQVANDIEPATARDCVAAYHSTFHAASSQPGADFQALIDEQTPGGMNEQVPGELGEKGSYDNLKLALDKLLPRLLG